MSTPAVKIVSDEEDKAIQGLVDQKVAEALNKALGRVPGVVDPRNTPNFQNWQKGLTASPFGNTAGQQPPAEDLGSDFRGVIKEFLGSPQFLAYKTHAGEKPSDIFVPTNKSVWGDRSKVGFVLPSHGHVEAALVSRAIQQARIIDRAAQMEGVSDGRTVSGTQYDGFIHIKPNRVNHFRDLLNVVSVEVGDVKFLQEVGFTDGTIMMPENTDPASTTSITNSVMGIQMVGCNLKQISTKIDVPDQYMEDVNQIQAFLEMRLEELGFNKEDSQIASGDNSGNNMNGFFTDSLIQALLWSDCTVGETEIDSVLTAMILCWIVNIEPDGHFAHPTQWGNFCKAKDANKRYLIDGVHQENPNKVLWGKPVALSVVAPTGKWLTGSFGTNAVVYDRMTPTIYMAREHGTNRDKNISTFYLNRRSAVAKFRPEGFAKVTFDSAPV